MLPIKRLVLLICPVVLLVFCATACVRKTQIYPTPNINILPTEDVMPAPTFTKGEPFECWTAPASETSTSSKRTEGKLLLAFSIERSDGELNLFQFDLASRQYSLLATHIMPWVNYPVSTDGQYLWYLLDARPAPVAYVYYLANATTHQVPFPTGSVSNKGLVWSPDNLCLLLWRKSSAIAYRLIDGALQERVFPTTDFGLGNTVVPSANGHWWAWSCKKNVCLMSPDGQQIDHEGLHLPIRTDPSNPDPNTAYYNHSTMWWSPDSHTLAVIYSGHDWKYRDALRLVQIDEHGVTSFRDIVTINPEPIYDIRWSPDSSQLLIVYHSKRTDHYNLRTGQITPVLSPNGYPALVVSPAWSPTSQQIAFVTRDNRNLYIMNPDGTNESELPLLPQDMKGADMVAPDYRIIQVFWVP